MCLAACCMQLSRQLYSGSPFHLFSGASSAADQCSLASWPFRSMSCLCSPVLACARISADDSHRHLLADPGMADNWMLRPVLHLGSAWDPAS